MTVTPSTLTPFERDSLQDRYGVCWNTQDNFDLDSDLVMYHRDLGTSHWYLPEMPRLKKKAYDTEIEAYRVAIQRKAKIASLVDFKLHTAHNAYVYENGLEIYVRKSYRAGIDFELANITAKKPGRGKFTEFLDTYEPHYSFYIENVLEPRFEEYFQRRGYEKISNPSTVGYDIPSFIWRTT